MLKKKSPSSVFRGKQGQMYATLLLAWANYTGYQGDFAKKNSKYTKELAEQQEADIEAARLQPNVKQRRNVPKEARDVLGGTAVDMRASWQDLSSLIESSFAPAQWEIKKSAAGSNYYLNSSAENWAATFDLGDAATAFITDNEEALTTGGMLPAFPQQFADAKKAYNDLYSTFYGTKQGAKDSTVEKTDANNTIFKTAISMMKDGVKIFRNNQAVSEKFIYNSLMKIVRGEGFIKTGYTIMAKDSVTHVPLLNATIVFTEGKNSYTAKMGKTGNLHCEMPAGNYNYTLKADGYNTVIGNVRAVEGSMRQKTLKLTQDHGSNLTQTARAI